MSKNPKVKNRPPKDFEVVFDKKGNLPARVWRAGQGAIKEQNKAFPDHMEYHGHDDGKIIMKSVQTGRTYYMFLSDFDDILKAKKMVNNQVIGIFCFCRKGSVQGLRLIFDDP